MSLPKIISYEVKMSRTEQKVPIVNGVHLHSIYNPFKEAEGLVSGQLESLKSKNEVMILGLGFSYHVNAIAEKLTQLYGDDFKIVVIEPNIQIYNECLSHKLIDKKNVLVYSGFKPLELYSDLEFIHFLLRKPAVIAHPPSFNLYQDYFKTILTFEAPKSIKAIKEFVTSDEIKKYLNNFDNEKTLEDILFNEIPNKKTLEELDFLAMAVVEITQKSHNEINNQGDA